MTCQDCKENIEAMNRFSRILPPTHHCRLYFDPNYKEGRLIWNPNSIPNWCPNK